MSNKDIFISLVRIKGDLNNKVVFVKSIKFIEKELWREFFKVFSRIYISIFIDIGDIICKNIMNIGIDIVCIRRIDWYFLYDLMYIEIKIFKEI